MSASFVTSAVTNIRHKYPEIKVRDKPRTNRYKEITCHWDFDANCTLTSLPVSELDNIYRFIYTYSGHTGKLIIRH